MSVENPFAARIADLACHVTRVATEKRNGDDLLALRPRVTRPAVQAASREGVGLHLEPPAPARMNLRRETPLRASWPTGAGPAGVAGIVRVSAAIVQGAAHRHATACGRGAGPVAAAHTRTAPSVRRRAPSGSGTGTARRLRKPRSTRCRLCGGSDAATHTAGWSSRSWPTIPPWPTRCT
jgi:hypothetical protein